MRVSRRILTLSMLGVAAASAYLFATAPWPNHEFAVLGKPVVIKSHPNPAETLAAGTLAAGTLAAGTLAAGTLAPGLGMHCRGPISNAFAGKEAAIMHEAGTYSAGGTRFDQHGKMQSWAVQFREGPWTDVDANVVERTVHTPVGIEFCSYRVRIRGAHSADGSQWCYHPQISGQGHGPDFSVVVDVRYQPITRTLELQLLEKLGSRDPTDYRIHFTVHLDGSLTRTG